VIGGGAGVGAAVTLALARAGVDVAFCDVKEDAIRSTRGAVERLGRQVVTSVTDALDVDQLRMFYATCDDTFDHLDILVNVVGGVRKREFSVTAPDQWSDDIHRNFGWVLHSTSLAIPRIRSSGRGGSIINFTTIEAHRGAAGYAAYAGAKAGLTNFSRALAVELGQEKIRVNLVAPDSTLSQQTKETMAASASAIGLRLRAPGRPTTSGRPRGRRPVPGLRALGIGNRHHPARRWRDVGLVGLPEVARAPRMGPHPGPTYIPYRRPRLRAHPAELGRGANPIAPFFGVHGPLDGLSWSAEAEQPSPEGDRTEREPGPAKSQTPNHVGQPVNTEEDAGAGDRRRQSYRHRGQSGLDAR
jgi:NAD(P)-dependent dehydrogenase (short-subunit alcohol dehydrogenase family)